MAQAQYRTVITTVAGLAALLGIGALRLDPSAVSVLSLAVVGVCGGAAAKSGAEAVAKARNGGSAASIATEVARHFRPRPAPEAKA